ncbi:hypothetical protein [Limosilactobacillus reuteri]|nr:hypothetical protein [Limosilactobacillus reuteri]
MHRQVHRLLVHQPVSQTLLQVSQQQVILLALQLHLLQVHNQFQRG